MQHGVTLDDNLHEPRFDTISQNYARKSETGLGKFQNVVKT